MAKIKENRAIGLSKIVKHNLRTIGFMKMSVTMFLSFKFQLYYGDNIIHTKKGYRRSSYILMNMKLNSRNLIYLYRKVTFIHKTHNALSKKIVHSKTKKNFWVKLKRQKINALLNKNP